MSESTIREMPPRKQEERSKEPLVGWYFHTFTEREGKVVIQSQGKVMERVVEQVYLVAYFSWEDGLITHSRLVNLDCMYSWHFYESRDDMCLAYDTKLEKS